MSTLTGGQGPSDRPGRIRPGRVAMGLGDALDWTAMGLDNPIHIIFILVVLLLVFGARRLPEIGRSLGTGMPRVRRRSVTGQGRQGDARPDGPAGSTDACASRPGRGGSRAGAPARGRRISSLSGTSPSRASGGDPACVPDGARPHDLERRPGDALERQQVVASSQRGSDAPVKNQLDPLSATIIP